jgi:acetyltransferase-like isoleucine patch superfamily enzyme
MKLLNYAKYYAGKLVRGYTTIRYRSLGITIGKDVFISHRAVLDVSYPGLIRLDDGVFVTSGAVILSHDHSAFRLSRTDDSKGRVHLKRNSFIGVNAIIMRNVTIGENAIVAAGSVVTKDVPDNTVVAGNPAKVVRVFTPIHDNIHSKGGFSFSKL